MVFLQYPVLQARLCRFPTVSRRFSIRSRPMIPMNGGNGVVEDTPAPATHLNTGTCLHDEEIVGSKHKKSNGRDELSSKSQFFYKRRTRIDLRPVEQTKEDRLSRTEGLAVDNVVSHVDRFSLPAQFGKKKDYEHDHVERFKSAQFEVERFDICLSECRCSDALQSCLNVKDEINHDSKDCSTIEGTRYGVLRPGMVLLKHHISVEDQVRIVKTCRDLGLGPGGFYRPGYQDGAKLRLQMMCLGLNWDPETRKYEDWRPVDGCKAPGIPCEFNLLVDRAIHDAHNLIKEDFKLKNVEYRLPAMSPNICIVNFYTANGRLGLHQDRDESAESLRKGLPVVSFSIGDSAAFVYGDQRDKDKAEKIVLESGDVLIFGGKSRHIYHGVTSIIPNSAPEALVEESRIRPGRLNLTFRQY